MSEKTFYIVKDDENKLLAIFTDYDDMVEFVEPYMVWSELII